MSSSTVPAGRHRALNATFAALALVVSFSAASQDAATPAFKELDSMEARVQGCVTCHGQSGQGTSNGYFPRIAGKPAGYLYNQLVAFRDGTRKYPPMNYLVAYLPDAYLREIAEYFAKQRPPFAAQEAPTANSAALARGQTLVDGGRQQERHSAVHRLPWRGPDRHGARHPGPGRAAAHLHRRRSSRAGGSATGTRPSPIA